MTTEFTKEEIEKVAQAILKNSSSDGDVIKLGNLIELKPVYGQDNTVEGYDIYKYADEELMAEDEDYDFDADYICTVYVGSWQINKSMLK